MKPGPKPPPDTPADPQAVSSQRGRGSVYFAFAVLAGWIGATLAELLLGLRVWVSFGLTIAETLAIPAFTAALLGLAQNEWERAPRSRRTVVWIVHIVVLVLLAGSIAGQYEILLQVHADPSTARMLRPSYETYKVIACLLVVSGMLGSPLRIARMVANVADHPARLMAGSFGIAAALGTLVLALPISLNHVEDASLLHALFNAMSAVCVTGLAVGNVAETYSTFGQVVLFALFQMGGLGIMSLSTFFAVLGGRRLQARHAQAMADLLDVDSFVALRRSLVGVVTFTLVIEAAGALVLYSALGDDAVALTAAESSSPMAGAGSRAWAAIFHAVSAYCNAGFSNFRDGLLPFSGSYVVGGAVASLIILGGLGFPVMFEVGRRFVLLVKRRRRPRMSLNTRVVLITTLVLCLAGTVMFIALEHGRSMRDLSWPERLMAGFFQSVTCRTAGFSTVDFGAMGPAAWMIACSLMFIGASPGSTGGGLKTTTFAVLLATLSAELRRVPQATLGGRALSTDTVRRAVGVTFLSVIVVSGVLFVLLLTESHDPARVAFEAVSAVSTTGLSTGITSDLSPAGQLVVTFGMFIGRIGPLTAALAVGNVTSRQRYRLVEERIAIG